MDRFTGRNENGDLIFCGEQVYGSNQNLYNALSELEQYELTNLEPDEIPHWIPVNEKLPKTSDEYLVLTENGDMFNANFDKDCGDNGEFGEWQDRYDEHTLGFLDSEWSSYGGITHWMPLPQPPKGEK